MPPVLVCPGCRTRDERGLHVRQLDGSAPVLVCECGRRHPMIDGVPILLADPAQLSRIGVLDADLSPDIGALFAEPGPDDAPYARHLEHLSIYLDGHWGDRASPPPDGPVPVFALAAIIERLAKLPRVTAAVELGCSMGRIVAELAQNADHVTGLDLSHGAVRRARRLLAGESLVFARRLAGRHYEPATAQADDRAVPSDRVTLVCGDALDPPLLPGVFQRVVALNVLDAVPHPRQLLLVMDNLCAPGGELVLTSPYAWQSTIMDDADRLGGADPGAEVLAILTEGRGLGSNYEIVEQADLPWTLRRDSRGGVVYRTHFVRARKGT